MNLSSESQKFFNPVLRRCWKNVMNLEEVIGKAWKTQPPLPSKIIVMYIKINEDKRIANEFNNFFKDISPEQAKEIPRPASSFESYVPKSTRLCTLNQLVLMN